MVVGELAENFITYYFEQMKTILDALGFPFDDNYELPPEHTIEVSLPLCGGYAEHYEDEVMLIQSNFYVFSDGLTSCSVPNITLSEYVGFSQPYIYQKYSFVGDNGATYSEDVLTHSYHAPTTAISFSPVGGPLVYWLSDAPALVTVNSPLGTSGRSYKDYCEYQITDNTVYVYRKEPVTYEKEKDFFTDVIVKEPTMNVPDDYVVPSLPKDPHDLGEIPTFDIPALPDIPIEFDALEGSTADAGGILQWMLNAYTEIGIAPILLFCMAVCIVITALRR